MVLAKLEYLESQFEIRFGLYHLQIAENSIHAIENRIINVARLKDNEFTHFSWQKYIHVGEIRFLFQFRLSTLSSQKFSITYLYVFQCCFDKFLMLKINLAHE